MPPESKHIVFFDGECNLCNSSVQRIIRNDKKSIFFFAPLQGDYAKNFLAEFGVDPQKLNTILYFNGEKVYSKSGAVLRIAGKLKFPYPLLYPFLLVPGFIRNAVYDYVGKNRYKWYGKRDSCMIPDKELLSRFL